MEGVDVKEGFTSSFSRLRASFKGALVPFMLFMEVGTNGGLFRLVVTRLDDDDEDEIAAFDNSSLLNLTMLLL